MPKTIAKALPAPHWPQTLILLALTLTLLP
jgi:hypothetical protein